ncbi:hypothetical protein MBM_03223 [Drepanopeziza brunnea f. sp. 'multigermtubi' MB_m1]|uniref:Uncharacterized protein n=1 Tax=Marssonina brunnea f. sp. multigermtubi (strain MB_m1) TaxID=1072389 RepID=K1WKP3_MARBU|nr:uncharacterized protein MBM_03223 [Drepanopeziza brunnea f. sp. 'multigermtubi' MB_m1]EKD18230.1 hypothetical protein MBM_03223 [Drepanopeziza brunnea f. sp. 'multigermtubi' MB_m1]
MPVTILQDDQNKRITYLPPLALQLEEEEQYQENAKDTAALTALNGEGGDAAYGKHQELNWAHYYSKDTKDTAERITKDTRDTAGCITKDTRHSISITKKTAARIAIGDIAARTAFKEGQHKDDIKDIAAKGTYRKNVKDKAARIAMKNQYREDARNVAGRITKGTTGITKDTKETKDIKDTKDIAERIIKDTAESITIRGWKKKGSQRQLTAPAHSASSQRQLTAPAHRASSQGQLTGPAHRAPFDSCEGRITGEGRMTDDGARAAGVMGDLRGGICSIGSRYGNPTEERSDERRRIKGGCLTSATRGRHKQKPNFVYCRPSSHADVRQTLTSGIQINCTAYSYVLNARRAKTTGEVASGRLASASAAQMQIILLRCPWSNEQASKLRKIVLTITQSGPGKALVSIIVKVRSIGISEMGEAKRAIIAGGRACGFWPSAVRTGPEISKHE